MPDVFFNESESVQVVGPRACGDTPAPNPTTNPLSFSTPGTFAFRLPGAYDTLTIEQWGASQGGETAPGTATGGVGGGAGDCDALLIPFIVDRTATNLFSVSNQNGAPNVTERPVASHPRTTTR